jgi:hypothetical protein
LHFGHHFTDVTTTIMMNILYGSEFKTMLPKLKSDNFKRDGINTTIISDRGKYY